MLKTYCGGILLTLSLVACGGESIATHAPTLIPVNEATNSQIPRVAELETKPLRFLALGDSYTIGQSVTVSERWPIQLVRRMRDAGVVVSDPEIIAQTGWTTGDLSSAIDQVNPEGTYDIVSLLIGVNNQFRGLDVDQYQTEFLDLHQRAVTLADGDPSHVIVISIPDWGVTPFAQGRNRRLIAEEIDLFNSVNLTEATRIGAPYVSVTGISRKALTESNLIADDGLHPSGEMYSQWVDIVLPVAFEISPVPTPKWPPEKCARNLAGEVVFN